MNKCPCLPRSAGQRVQLKKRPCHLLSLGFPKEAGLPGTTVRFSKALYELDCFLARSARLLSHFGGKVAAVHGQSRWQRKSLEGVHAESSISQAHAQRRGLLVVNRSSCKPTPADILYMCVARMRASASARC